MITYFNDKNNKSKTKNQKYERITTIIKSFDTFVFFAPTSSSIILSPTGIGSIVIPKSTASASALSISIKVLYEIVINKYNGYEKQYEKDHRTIKTFDNLYRKILQDNIFDKNEYGCLCNIFTKNVDKKEYESFF